MLRKQFRFTVEYLVNVEEKTDEEIADNAKNYYDSETLNSGEHLKEYDRMKRLLTALLEDEEALLHFTKLRFQGLTEAYADDLLKKEFPFEDESKEEKKILSPVIKRLSTKDQEVFAEAEKNGVFSESINLVFSAFRLGLLGFSVEEAQDPIENVEMLPDSWY